MLFDLSHGAGNEYLAQLRRFSSMLKNDIEDKVFEDSRYQPKNTDPQQDLRLHQIFDFLSGPRGELACDELLRVSDLIPIISKLSRYYNNNIENNNSSTATNQQQKNLLREINNFRNLLQTEIPGVLQKIIDFALSFGTPRDQITKKLKQCTRLDHSDYKSMSLHT